MKIDKALISKLEKLAQLELSAEEAEALQNDLEAMVGMIGKMQEINTQGVAPLTHVSEAINNLRKDKTGLALDRDAALRNAPVKNDPYFQVPKVIKQHKPTK